MSVVSVFSVDYKNRIIMIVFIAKAFVFFLVTISVVAFAAWLDKSNGKGKDRFSANAFNRVYAFVTSKIELMMMQHKTGPWYLVVYTQESYYPLWISNNNIRSVYPDIKNRKLIIKQFKGEDMVIEKVNHYQLCAANEMCDYNM